MIDKLIDRLIQIEGGFVNDSVDRGGPTKYGITQATLSHWRGTAVTAKDVENLDLQETRQIYLMQYWVKPRICDLKLSEPLQEMVFDAGVHHGVSRATKLLQSSMSVAADGIIGTVTINAAQRLNGPHLAALFMAERVEFIAKIIHSDPSQVKFANGRFRRCGNFIRAIPLA